MVNGDLWDAVEINGKWITREEWCSLEFSKKVCNLLRVAKIVCEDMAELQWLEQPHKDIERCVNELGDALDKI